MTMHQGLDLSRLQKISSDKKTTKLRHRNGHEITVAHSGLTPKMREQIEGLPVYMAEGGEAKKEADAPVELAVEPEAPPAPEPTLAPEAAPAVVPEPAPTPEAMPPPAAAPQIVPPKPKVMPQGGTVDVVGTRKPRPTAQDLDNDDAFYAQDVIRGHIKPETYQSLYAKKDTLGKIGTLFGLLLGGGGSGLTGQPNAVLAMMDKQIENDLKAQQSSNENAQNWLRLSQAHVRQKAEIEKMGVESELTKAQTGKIPAETKKLEAETLRDRADADLIASNAALNRMRIAAFNDLQNRVNGMPPGPQKQAAQDLLTNTLGPAIQEKNTGGNIKTTSLIDARDALTPPEAPKKGAQDDSPIDLEKFNLLQQQGQMNSSMQVPGGFQGGDTASATKEAELVKQNRASFKMWEDSFKRLDKAFAAGVLNPQLRKAEIATLGAQIARATAGRFNAEEAAAQADGMFPSPKDWGSSRGEKYRKGVEYFQSEEAATPTLDRYGLKRPFPEPAGFKKDKGGGKSPGKSSGGPKDGAKGTSKDGKPMTYRNGAWRYDK